MAVGKWSKMYIFSDSVTVLCVTSLPRLITQTVVVKGNDDGWCQKF